MKINKSLSKKRGFGNIPFINASYFQVALVIAIVIVAGLFMRDVTVKQDQQETTNLTPTQTAKPSPTQMVEQKVSVTTTPSPTHMPIQKGEQKDCTNGYYFFEDEDVSVCYPAEMKLQTDTFMNVDTRETIHVTFSNDSRQYDIFPRYSYGSGGNKCRKMEETQVNGNHVSRIIDSPETANGCGDIGSIYAFITSNNSGIMLFGDAKEGGSFDPNEYYTVESSLRIK